MKCQFNRVYRNVLLVVKMKPRQLAVVLSLCISVVTSNLSLQNRFQIHYGKSVAQPVTTLSGKSMFQCANICQNMFARKRACTMAAYDDVSRECVISNGTAADLQDVAAQTSVVMEIQERSITGKIVEYHY